MVENLGFTDTDGKMALESFRSTSAFSFAFHRRTVDLKGLKFQNFDITAGSCADVNPYKRQLSLLYIMSSILQEDKNLTEVNRPLCPVESQNNKSSRQRKRSQCSLEHSIIPSTI